MSEKKDNPFVLYIPCQDTYNEVQAWRKRIDDENKEERRIMMDFYRGVAETNEKYRGIKGLFNTLLGR